MHEQFDLRKRVVAELQRRVGDLRSVAEATKLSYDTVLRIKNEEGDPGFSKVQALADFLFTSPPADVAAPDVTAAESTRAAA